MANPNFLPPDYGGGWQEADPRDPPGQTGGTDWADVERQLRQYGGNLYDPTDLEGIKRNTGYNVGGVGLDQALASQRGIYDQRRGPAPASPQSATAQYSGGATSAPGAGDAALGSFQSALQTRDQAAQQQRQALQQILMQQLGQAQQSVSAASPGIAEVLAGQRIGLQRGAERQRKNAAELRAYDQSGGVGGKAFDTDVERILQQQGESEAQMTGQVLGHELDAKRQQLTQLLTLATQLGDAESARVIQAQLAAIQTQLQQSNFYDTQAFNYAGLNQQGNLQTLLALLNAA